MSFQDSDPLESQPTTWRRNDDPQYADDPEFERYTSELSDKLFSLTSNIGRLSNQIALLGTKRETDRVRERVQDLLQETGDSFKDIGEGLKKVQAWHDLGPSQKYTQGKLNNEFKATLTEFQGLQRQALEKQRASATAAKAALDQEGGATSPSATTDQGQRTQQQLLEQQPRLADQDEVDFQESLIVERESEIRNIEQSVGELNELFRDVAHMVHEQGQSLDIISENVTQTRDDTQNADQQLRTASRHQRSARGKACCLLLILVVVVVVIVLAAVLGGRLSSQNSAVMAQQAPHAHESLLSRIQQLAPLRYADVDLSSSEIRDALHYLASTLMQKLDVDQRRIKHDDHTPGQEGHALRAKDPDDHLAVDVVAKWLAFAVPGDTERATEGCPSHVLKLLLLMCWGDYLRAVYWGGAVWTDGAHDGVDVEDVRRVMTP